MNKKPLKLKKKGKYIPWKKKNTTKTKGGVKVDRYIKEADTNNWKEIDLFCLFVCLFICLVGLGFERRASGLQSRALPLGAMPPIQEVDL
jgi:hypothetical protein